MGGPITKIPASFIECTAITQLDATTYAADLAPAFCIGTVPNGGYVASLFVKVASAHLSSRKQIDTIAAHWQYLGRTQAGRALLVVEETKLGRSTSVLHISLYQSGLLSQSPWISPGAKHEVSAYITNGNLETENGLTLATGWTLPHPPPAVDLAKLGANKDKEWERYTVPLMDRVPSFHNLEYYARRAGHAFPTTQDYWIRTAIGEPLTGASLAHIADAAPALLLEQYRTKTRDAPTPEGGIPYSKGYWYPTLVMSLDVRKRLPEAGEEWLRLRVAAKTINNGRLDVEILIFDVAGDLVALSHHVALAVDSERNYANREKPQNYYPKKQEPKGKI